MKEDEECMMEPISKFVPYELTTSVIKVNSYEEKKIKGSLFNSYYKDEMQFDNLAPLIFLIEDMLNALQYPQKGMESRSFRKEYENAARAVRTSVCSSADKVLATFKINVLFRQNASWQGSIVWLEQEMESQFRSILELILLMDSVLTN